MLAYIKGKLITHSNGAFIIEAGGIGYRVLTSYSTLKNLPPKGEDMTTFTYLNVREDAFDLFGFATENELDCFKLVTTVSGVGPRVGLSILSELSPEQFALAVATKDAKTLTRAGGVGNKLAQRIILELTDKITNEQLTESVSKGSKMSSLNFIGEADEAISALVVLGYSQGEALRVVRKFDTDGMTTEDIIKAALVELMK